jgi:hypothetical protein
MAVLKRKLLSRLILNIEDDENTCAEKTYGCCVLDFGGKKEDGSPIYLVTNRKFYDEVDIGEDYDPESFNCDLEYEFEGVEEDFMDNAFRLVKRR